MEARLLRAVALAALLLVSMGARFQSANYIVETADPRLAQQIDQAAERYRHDLAIQWLGQAMPNWAAALPDDGPGRAALGGRRGHPVHLRSRRGLRLADDHSRVGRADFRLGVAARDHAHGVCDAFSPPAAALGRRGRGHEHGMPQREGEATRHALAVPPHGARNPLQPDVRHDRISPATSCRCTPKGIRWPSISFSTEAAASTCSSSTTRWRAINGRRPCGATTAWPTWRAAKRLADVGPQRFSRPPDSDTNGDADGDRDNNVRRGGKRAKGGYGDNGDGDHGEPDNGRHPTAAARAEPDLPRAQQDRGAAGLGLASGRRGNS